MGLTSEPVGDWRVWQQAIVCRIHNLGHKSLAHCAAATITWQATPRCDDDCRDCCLCRHRCRKLLLPPSGTCVPYTEGHYSLTVWQSVVQMSQQIVGQTHAVPVINTFNWTVPLHFAHIPLENNGWDCLHYCRPGLSEVRPHDLPD